jgi:hypothetical protein
MQDSESGSGNDRGGGGEWAPIPSPSDPNYDQKVAAVFEKLGRPADARGYKFSDPKDFALDDVDKEYRESFRGVAHRLHLTQKQVDGLTNWQYGNTKLMRDAQKAARENTGKATRDALTREYGNGLGDRINAAKATMNEMKLGALANATLQNGARVGDTTEFVRMMVALSERGRKAASEAAFAGYSVPIVSDEASAIEEQIKGIEESAIEKGYDPTHRMWPHRQLDPLYKRLHGTEALDTTGSRPPRSKRS